VPKHDDIEGRKIPILAYHSWRFSSDNYTDNDHVALTEDLKLIDEMGLKVVPLSMALSEAKRPSIKYPLVGLTFDDGAVYDFKVSADSPGTVCPGFYPVLKTHCRKKSIFRRVQPWLHATSFVIASSQAHDQINRGHGDDFNWLEPDAWSDSWWVDAAKSDFLGIGNHSWDHNHPSVDTVIDSPSGDFFCVNNFENAEKEIAVAQHELKAKYDIDCPYFAYPWGHCSEYLSEQYLPQNGASLGLLAAFTTEPTYLTRDSHIWRIPRFVCGDHWKSTGELAHILSQAR